uniref:LOB domain-containing protein n=1 Tax=Chenopodium quinoa TaxID=63459 RepID=A0A803M7Z5_CHEQI
MLALALPARSCAGDALINVFWHLTFRPLNHSSSPLLTGFLGLAILLNFSSLNLYLGITIWRELSLCEWNKEQSRPCLGHCSQKNDKAKDLPESQRADAVSSMVYEANARLRDPVYGCAGAICQLQKQVNDLQAQLAKAQAEILNMKCQQTNLLALICMEMAHDHDESPPSNTSSQSVSPEHPNRGVSNNACFIDDNNLGGSLWEPLWT